MSNFVVQEGTQETIMNSFRKQCSETYFLSVKFLNSAAQNALFIQRATLLEIKEDCMALLAHFPARGVF